MDIRERIIKACRDLAVEQGLRGFTMDELAQRAGLSKRTVYRYFDSKQAIIQASLDIIDKNIFSLQLYLAG